MHRAPRVHNRSPMSSCLFSISPTPYWCIFLGPKCLFLKRNMQKEASQSSSKLPWRFPLPSFLYIAYPGEGLGMSRGLCVLTSQILSCSQHYTDSCCICPDSEFCADSHYSCRIHAFTSLHFHFTVAEVDQGKL